MPAELALQELCAEAAESAELDELWASLLAFVALFLLCVSYGAAVTLLKVGAADTQGEGTLPAEPSSPCPLPR